MKTTKKIKKVKKKKKLKGEMSKKEKAEYVKAAEQTRSHTCHWPGCKEQIPPAMWGCKPHWFKVPRKLRGPLWDAFRPGQEIDMNPSQAYLEAADKIQRWIKKYGED